MFDNSPVEYAMLQGWDLQFENWTDHQKQMFLNWSNSKTVSSAPPAAPSVAPSASPFNVKTVSDSTWNTAFNVDFDELPELPSEVFSAPGSVEMQELGTRSFVTNESSRAPTAIQPGSIEMQELGTASFVTNESSRGPASPWEMEPSPTPGYNINDLEKVRTPGIDISNLENSGMSEAQITEVLSENVIGVNSMGEGMFDLNGLMNSLGGVAFNNIIIRPILNSLMESGDVGKVIGNVVNIYGAIGMFMSADFVGLGVQGLMQVVDMYTDQLERIKSNDYSSDNADTRLMMVRDGNKWYPAVLKDRMKGEGLLDSANTISVVYGRPEDLKFVYEDGKYRAHFTHQKQKTFRMDDSEWSGEKSTLEYANKRDFMRPFYFLTKEEASTVLQGYGTKDFAWKIKDVDESEFTPFMKKYSDLQTALDFMQNSEQHTGDGSTFLQSDARGIRRKLNNRMLDGERAFEYDTYQNSRVLPKADDTFGFNTEWDSYTDFTHIGLPSMAELNKNVITRKLRTLGTTRKNAAYESGVDWRVYNDFSKDLPAAKSAEQLQTQFKAIDAYDDRSDSQKQYLKEKAGVRYLMSFVNDMGYGADLFDVLTKETDYDAITKRNTEQQKNDPDKTENNYYGTVYNEIPSRYTGPNGTTHLNSIPSWTNKGESPFQMVKGQLSGWQTEIEDSYEKNYDILFNRVTEEIGYDPTEKIKQNGTRIRTENIATKIANSKQFTKRLPDIPESSVIKPPMQDGPDVAKTPTQIDPVIRLPEPEKQDDFMSRIKNQHDKTYMDLLNELEKQRPAITGNRIETSKPDYPEKYYDSNEDITLSNFIDRINTPDFEFNTIGESSHLHFIESVLNNDVPWVPDNYKLDENIIPKKWIQGNENVYKPLLHQIDDNPSLKSRSEYLNNLVSQPRQEEYAKQYHSSETFQPKDLSDDWSLPYKFKQNSVEFNHKIESQMDFDYEETLV